jgi:hypothetical protein
MGCIACMLTLGLLAADPPADDWRQLEGSWIIVQQLYTPSPKADKVAAYLFRLGNEVRIHKGMLAPEDKGRSDYHLLVQLFPSSRPKGIDLKVPGDPGLVLPGVYALDGQILNLVIGLNNRRPTTVQPGEDRLVLILIPRGFRARR